MTNLFLPDEEAVKRSPEPELLTISPANAVVPEREATGIVPPLVEFARTSSVPPNGFVALIPSLPLNEDNPVPFRGEKVRLPVVLPPKARVWLAVVWIAPVAAS